jgi:hypothetical protein
VTIPPATDVETSHDGQAGLLVVSGRVEVTIGQNTKELDCADSAFSSSAQLIRLRNIGPAIAEVLWVYLDATPQSDAGR